MSPKETAPAGHDLPIEPVVQDLALSRRDYMTTEGFLLATDINDRILEELSRKVPQKAGDLQEIAGQSSSLANTDPSAATLYITASALFEPLRKSSTQISRAFLRQHGVTKNEQKNAAKFGNFAMGLGDRDFAWHFAPAVASVAVATFAREGYISQTEHERLSLADWANVIGSGWFSKLVHSMAFTVNGVYQRFGQEATDYGEVGLRKTLHGSPLLISGDVAPLIVSEQFEPEDGLTYLTAQLSTPVRSQLRKVMKDRESPGCPAARYASSLLPEVIETNSHLHAMQHRGTMEVMPKWVAAERSMVRQQYTTIDRSLALLADKLEEYEHLYGPPRIPRIVDGVFEEFQVAIGETNVLRYDQKT